MPRPPPALPAPSPNLRTTGPLKRLSVVLASVPCNNQVVLFDFYYEINLLNMSNNEFHVKMQSKISIKVELEMKNIL